MTFGDNFNSAHVGDRFCLKLRNSFVEQFGQPFESSTSIKAMLAAFARFAGFRHLNIEGLSRLKGTSFTAEARGNRQLWCLSLQLCTPPCSSARVCWTMTLCQCLPNLDPAHFFGAKAIGRSSYPGKQ